MTSSISKRIEAETLYNSCYKYVLAYFKDENTTYGRDLDRICHKVLDKNFLGVFAVDEIPIEILDYSHLFIVNLDRSDQPGSHWIAVGGTGHSFIIFDSFGRKSSEIVPKLTYYFYTFDTEHDAEQDDKENNCGQLCVAWLLLHNLFGGDYSIYI